jgi:transposase
VLDLARDLRVALGSGTSALASLWADTWDAHDRAFAFFRGACTRGIYDNMKTAVDAILVGKARDYNRRFQQMCGHYLVEPVACAPASGWEKGQGGTSMWS